MIIDNQVVFDPSIELQEILIARPSSSRLPVLIRCSSHDKPSFTVSLHTSTPTTRHSLFHYQSPVIQTTCQKYISIHPLNLPVVPEMWIDIVPQLPTGLSLEANGTIRGIPIEPVHETYTITVIDAENHDIASTMLVLTITSRSGIES